VGSGKNTVGLMADTVSKVIRKCMHNMTILACRFSVHECQPAYVAGCCSWQLFLDLMIIVPIPIANLHVAAHSEYPKINKQKCSTGLWAEIYIYMLLRTPLKKKLIKPTINSNFHLKIRKTFNIKLKN
jgi:hypothetical protein